jgi:ABC-type multidrug transport system ATPase subunit/pSer/pThr/pTyr-binding forkhead associated (FHA) protein
MSGPGLRVSAGSVQRDVDGNGELVIGRDAQCDVVVDHPAVSRRHGTVRPDGRGGWMYVDQSENGTFVGGQPVREIPLAGTTVLLLGHPDVGPRVVAAPVRPTPYASKLARSAELALGPGQLSEVVDLTDARRTSIRIGRASDNDLVVDDVLASRYHAELRSKDGVQFEIVDLGSRNGTFLDGQRINRAPVPEGGLVAIGRQVHRLTRGRLEAYIDTGEIGFAGVDLGVQIDSKVLLQGVNFALEPSAFLAVLGPTGAGKSTLLKALTGVRPADYGAVSYNGRNLYRSYDELKARIGYVPQDDILHPQLTVRRALNFAARLRFAPDVTNDERNRRVEEVMGELGLTTRADLQVSRLSGGQRKRTSVAIELLTRPSLLFLDEPTSGLDPGYEKSVMQLLRSLADSGRTVIVITHSVQSLDMCDHILFLAPGGTTAWFGPPAECLPHFGRDDLADVFLDLDQSQPGAAATTYAQAPAQEHYVTQPVARHRQALSEAKPASTGGRSSRPSLLRQLPTLVARYMAVIAADRRNLVLLIGQAPLLGFLMLVGNGSGALKPGPDGKDSGTVILALVLGATYVGASNSIREVVKERAIYLRERGAGLSIPAYVLSKVFVLGGLTIAQSVVLTVFATALQGGPTDANVLGNGRLELMVGIALTGLAAMALGLAVSALVSNADKALTLLPVVLFVQFLFSGAAFDLKNQPVIGQMTYLSPSRWGYAAGASTTDVQRLTPKPPPELTESLAEPLEDRLWDHKAGIWLLDASVLVLMIFGSTAVTAAALSRLDRPGRRA